MSRGRFGGRATRLLISAGLAAATLSAYAQVGALGFVNYDDPAYVSDNRQVEAGLTWEGLRWALVTTHAANWHPLTWVSHMTDVELFGLDAGAHHTVSLLLHLANVLLVFHVLWRMTGAPWPSALAAALFALHPLHVESVAWVAERKDVLSTLFWLLATWAWVRYTERPVLPRYATVGVLFALGLASKPMLVTLPLTLILLHGWPLERRLPGRWGIAGLLALSALSGSVTLLAQAAEGAVLPLAAIPLRPRLAQAAVGCVAYLGKAAWPAGLAIPYPYPELLPWWKVAGAGLALAALSIVAVTQAPRRPYLLAGWLWYLVTLVPVIGIVQVGGQAMADRYTYVPLIGIFVAVAWGARDAAAAGPLRRAGVLVACTIVLAAFLTLTVRQVAVWRDTETLFSHALRVTQRNYVARTYLGIALKERGEVEAAIEQLEEVLAMGAAFADAPHALARIYEERGDLERAAGYDRLALDIEPDHAGALVDLGRMLQEQGRLEQALAHYEHALGLRPDDAQLLTNAGVVLTLLGRPDEAVERLERAARLDDRDAQVWSNLGAAYVEQGRLDEAERRLDRALALDADHAPAWFNRGVAAQRAGKLDRATRAFERAARLDPRPARVHAALGDTWARRGNRLRALEEYETAWSLDPQQPGLREKLEVARRSAERPR